MITIGVGELKPHFSDILNEVRNGEEVVISYGRRKEKVAAIIPYSKYIKRKIKENKRSAGEINHQLDSFIGTWIEDEEFDKAIKTFDDIDTELWK